MKKYRIITNDKVYKVQRYEKRWFFKGYHWVDVFGTVLDAENYPRFTNRFETFEEAMDVLREADLNNRIWRIVYDS